MDQLSDVIALLRKQDLLDRTTSVRVGNVSVTLVPETSAPDVVIHTPSVPVDPDEEYERTLFASSH
jgi:hypothetical protein